MTKRDIFYLVIILTIAILWRSCPNTKTTILTDSKRLKEYSDSTLKIIRQQEEEKELLKAIADNRDVVRVEWRDRWHDAKNIHDTIPCPEKLKIVTSVCDSALAADDSLIVTLDRIITLGDSIIDKYKKVREADSTNIELLHPRQNIFLGGDVATSGNLFITAGFDTKKGLFTAGYDPLNKQFKAAAYFKIPLWKRRK